MSTRITDSQLNNINVAISNLSTSADKFTAIQDRLAIATESLAQANKNISRAYDLIIRSSSELNKIQYRCLNGYTDVEGVHHDPGYWYTSTGQSAKSVLFIGTLTYTGTLYFPESVTYIEGLPNSEIILKLSDTDTTGISFAEVKNNNFISVSAPDHSQITNLSVQLQIDESSNSTTFIGFSELKNIYASRVSCIVNETQATSVNIVGYSNCHNIYDSFVDIYNKVGKATGYQDCSNINGCYVKALTDNTDAEGIGFSSCKGIISSGVVALEDCSTTVFAEDCSDIDNQSNSQPCQNVFIVKNQQDLDNLIDSNFSGVSVVYIYATQTYEITKAITLPSNITAIIGRGKPIINITLDTVPSTIVAINASNGIQELQNLYMIMNLTVSESTSSVSVISGKANLNNCNVDLNVELSGISGQLTCYGMHSLNSAIGTEVNIIINSSISDDSSSLQVVGYKDCTKLTACTSTIQTNILGTLNTESSNACYDSCTNITSCQGSSSGNNNFAIMRNCDMIYACNTDMQTDFYKDCLNAVSLSREYTGTDYDVE